MFYLTTHSTHFIYGYMASDIWLRTILIVRKETRCRHIGYSYRLTERVILYAHTTAFVTPVVEHWLEREIAQWVRSVHISFGFYVTILHVCYVNQWIKLFYGWSVTHLNKIPPDAQSICMFVSLCVFKYRTTKNKKKNVHRPGIEPGSPAWQASILPLDHRCLTYT